MRVRVRASVRVRVTESLDWVPALMHSKVSPLRVSVRVSVRVRLRARFSLRVRFRVRVKG